VNLCKARINFIKGYFSTNDRRPKTRAAYSADLVQFENFAGGDIGLGALCSTHIENWAANLKTEDYSPASIRRKLVVLKVFFGYWIRNGFLSESPFWRVKISVGRIVQLPRTLTEEEMRDLLKQAHHRSPVAQYRVSEKVARPSSRQFLLVRNRAIVELLFATGMRVGELSSMDLGDLIEDEAAIRIRGKGGKERMAFIVDGISRNVQADYLQARRSLEIENGAFFVNASGNRLSPQGIANVIKRFQRDSGIARHITPHMLRHTVATLLLRNGTDIRVVQEFLGHASIATTQRYTHIAKEHLISELIARHPSLNLRA
jgi:integrase/recombinase XerD